MKDLGSSFDRFTCSLASGVLFLFSLYCVIEAVMPGCGYWTFESFYSDPSSRVIFGLPLLFGAYLTGSINVLLADLIFVKCWSRYEDELNILDVVESRGHPILSKEIGDLVGLKRLLVASTVPLLVTGLALPWDTSGNEHKRGFFPYIAIGFLLVAMALASPFLAIFVQKQIRRIVEALPERTPK